MTAKTRVLLLWLLGNDKLHMSKSNLCYKMLEEDGVPKELQKGIVAGKEPSTTEEAEKTEIGANEGENIIIYAF